MVEQSAACMHGCIKSFSPPNFVGWKLPVISVGFFGLHAKPLPIQPKPMETSGTISALTHAKLVE